MMDRRSLTIGAALASVLAASGARGQTARQASRPAASGARNVVLVHGAFADGSSWAGVIARLQSAGMRVIAVQNPLTSLADDVAATRRALDMMDGPTVLVGHSYGGNVISEAGMDPKVASLVYVAALAPEPGEVLEDMTRGHPPAPGLAHVRAVGDFARLDEAGYLNDFAPDVPRAQARVMYAAQGPVAADLFGQKTTQAAWRDKPSWYVVATQDRMILPVVQRALAKKIGATAVEVLASHAVPVSHPAEVARVIQTAARARPKAA